jgi:hypothetical protein
LNAITRILNPIKNKTEAIIIEFSEMSLLGYEKGNKLILKISASKLEISIDEL